jgi:hypothetical protein
MNLETLQLLRSEQGRQALREARALDPTTARYPACVDRLRKHFPELLVRAALDVVLLLPKARVKFHQADTMLFDREGLEMATHQTVATYRAERFRSFLSVADLCCGIGGDAIGLASLGVQLRCVDLDPVRLGMTEVNLESHSLTADCRCEDVLQADFTGIQGFFVDPNRRTGGRRPLDPSDYQPPVPELLRGLQQYNPGLIGVKIAPGVAHEDWRKFQTETEFISLDGELKEAVLWFAEGSALHGRATVLPGPHHLEGDAAIPLASEPKNWIYDPDPAVVRAQQLGTLAVQLGATPLDDQIALLSHEGEKSTPFATRFKLVAAIPFHEKKVGEWLRVHHVGRLTLLQRGSGLAAERVQNLWRLKGDDHLVMILTKVLGVVTCLLCEPSSA